MLNLKQISHSAKGCGTMFSIVMGLVICAAIGSIIAAEVSVE
ncbi:hypothetical protein [Mesobacillus campisalis]|nr:hypothetical protein [Mesobacillus campisalis]